MLITLIIPSNLTPIALWKELPSLLFIRASVWLLGLSILPGLYLVRLTGVEEKLSGLTKIAVVVNLSLVLVGCTTLGLYYALENIQLLPYFLLGILALMGSTQWFNSNIDLTTARVKLSKCNMLLITGVIASTFIAFLVQVAQQYLIPGDVWVSLKPAVEILSQRDVYQAFMHQYPIMFGFILAGLSVCSGLPVVNTHVILFPLVALNTLSFFALVKIVFNLDDKLAVIASIIYTFSGGLAWLIQTVIYHGTKSFWSISYLTQDMYFAMPFWDNIMFFHKSLALTLAYTSLVTFALTAKFEDTFRKMIMLTLSSLLMLFSFFIHMLEPLILAPVILAIAYMYQRDRNRYLNLGLLAVITLLVAYVIDFLMYGWYSWLTVLKIKGFLSIVSVDKLLIYSILTLGGISIILTIRFLYRRLAKFYTHKSHLQSIKQLLVASLIGIYVSGLYFYAFPSSLGFSSSFPWYLYVTRYGFVGLLAIIGAAVARWREKWFIIASFWSIVAIVAGSIWWGSRLNAYLFPMVALFAAVGVNAMWKKSGNTIHITTTTTKNSVEKHFKLNLKPTMAALIIIILTLSSTSFIYGASYYISTGPCITDDTAKAFAWINQNTPQNATILVPKIYNIYKGIETISDRKTCLTNNLPNTVAADTFANLTKILQEYNIEYAVTTEDANEQFYTTKLLLSYSTVVFQSGQTKVFKLPQLKPPSQQYTVAALDKEPLGLPQINTFGWVDDNFTTEWNYKNVNATTDGEVLTFQWQFNTADQTEPSMKTYITPIDTNAHSYIIIKYRNTQETTTTAENNIGQIITLVNNTGYPKGFIKNFYLPISKEKSFTIFTAKLPENQNIAQIWIWMRNYKKLNGTIGLQIDYIGLSSTDSTPNDPMNLRFLSMAIPALWPTNYTIVSNITATKNANILITTYDKNVTNYIDNQSNTNTFIFLNTTATTPTWGTNWKTIQQGMISGNLNGKTILIIGISTIQLDNYEDLSKLAALIFESI